MAATSLSLNIENLPSAGGVMGVVVRSSDSGIWMTGACDAGVLKSSQRAIPVIIRIPEIIAIKMIRRLLSMGLLIYCAKYNSQAVGMLAGGLLLGT